MTSSTAYTKKWREQNPEKYRELKQAQRDRGAEILTALKKDKPCTDCGGYFPEYCMDFDHLDPTTKVRGVSALARGGFSLKKILAEVDKCELVCSNCHRIRTHDRQHEG